MAHRNPTPRTTGKNSTNPLLEPKGKNNPIRPHEGEVQREPQFQSDDPEDSSMENQNEEDQPSAGLMTHPRPQ